MRRIAGRLAKIDNEKEFPEYQRKIALSGTFTSPLNHELGLYIYIVLYIYSPLKYQRKIAPSGTFTSPLNHELGLHLLFYAYVCMYI
jgi:hypothetical protein